MRADQSAGGHVERGADRFRTPESYIHWDRGMAIVAGIVGIVSLFFLLLVTLPIGQGGRDETLTGLAQPPDPTAASAPAGAGQQASAATPATGPDQPRLTAITRQFPFVRRGPGINFAVIMNLQQGQRVEVVGRSPDRQWYQIVLPENPRERGWVSNEFLAVDGDLNTLPEVRE